MESNISVIVASYNSMNCIDRCVYSILGSIGVTIELIIIDDCSTDRTWEYIQKFADKAILIRNEKNHKGANYSYNLGLRMATSKWICFMDHDDEVLPGRFITQFHYNNLAPIISCNHFVISNKGTHEVEYNLRNNFKAGEVFRSLLSADKNGLHVQPQNLLVDKNICPGFSEEFPSEDFGFLVELFKGRSCYHINKPYLIRHINNNNLGSSLDYKLSTLEVRKRLFFPGYFKECKKGLKWQHSLTARYYFHNGDGVNCRKHLIKGELTSKNVFLYITSFLNITRKIVISKFNILGK